MVQEYLDGNLGKRPGDVNAYAASLFYAMDRYASYKQDWGAFYEAGGLVIADRYTTSNAVHQASKLPPEERKAFLDWLFELEYGKLGLPEPDLVLYLDMPTEITEKMMRSREAATGTHADIHEQDEAYLKSCREAAREIVKDCGWTVIHCAKWRCSPDRGGHPQRGVRDCQGAAVRPVPPAGRGASPPVQQQSQPLWTQPFPQLTHAAAAAYQYHDQNENDPEPGAVIVVAAHTTTPLSV